MTLRTLNYENYSIFLIMGNAGFCPSAVVLVIVQAPKVTGLPLWLVDFHLSGSQGLGVTLPSELEEPQPPHNSAPVHYG